MEGAPTDKNGFTKLGFQEDKQNKNNGPIDLDNFHEDQENMEVQ